VKILWEEYRVVHADVLPTASFSSAASDYNLKERYVRGSLPRFRIDDLRFGIRPARQSIDMTPPGWEVVCGTVPQSPFSD
jgi:hypothetical protein